MLKGKLVSVDPGNHTGWASFSLETTHVEKMGTIKTETEFWDWLDSQSPNIWVVEDYIMRPKGSDGFDHQWNKGLTLRKIGAIEFQARRTGSVFVLQQPSIKSIGYRWLGQTYVKGKKNQHYMDAIVHGNYYLVKNKLKLPGN